MNTLILLIALISGCVVNFFLAAYNFGTILTITIIGARILYLLKKMNPTNKDD